MAVHQRSSDWPDDVLNLHPKYIFGLGMLSRNGHHIHEWRIATDNVISEAYHSALTSTTSHTHTWSLPVISYGIMLVMKII